MSYIIDKSDKRKDMQLALPASRWHCHATLILAAFQGDEVHIAHSLMHDGQHAIIRALTDLNARIFTHDDSIHLESTKPIHAQDISIHIGIDIDNFYLLLAQYIIRPSRVRFTAEGSIKTINLTPITHFLPTLGSRLTYVVPKCRSFPVRIESSGVLPKRIVIPQDLPEGFVLALLTALPFAEDPVEVDIQNHPSRASILETSLSYLQNFEAKAAETQPWLIAFEPSKLSIPSSPNLPSESILACFLFALPLLLGGKANFEGIYPETPLARDCLGLLEDLGLKIHEKPDSQEIRVRGERFSLEGELPSSVHTLAGEKTLPYLCALLGSLALSGTKLTIEENLPPLAHEFFNTIGLELDSSGTLSQKSQNSTAPMCWNAPSPEWALALATAACKRKGEGFKLGNASVITQIWPRYWTLYNSLPNVQSLQKPAEATPKRRRILTSSIAEIPPEIERD